MQDTELALLFDRFMRQIHFGLQSKAATFDKEGVGPGGGIILLTIADMGCPGMQELTNRVARDKSQMTRSIRSLENKGLVARHASTDDARVTLISLTPAGQTVVSQLQIAVAETINEILDPISQADQSLLKEIMQTALDKPCDPKRA